MKKAIFAILVVALAILAVTCDNAVMSVNLSSGQGQGPVVEPEWTTISINIDDPNGRARAMNQTQDEGSVDFYEAVFYYAAGPIIVRSQRHTSETEPWNVTVPVATYYGGTNSAVLFAGTSDTNVLIGIGNRSAGGNFLTQENPSITFLVSAVTSAVTSDNTSSFKIIGDHATYATTTTSMGTLTVPVFGIPNDVATNAADYIEGSYTFKNLNNGVILGDVLTTFPVTSAGVSGGPTVHLSNFSPNTAGDTIGGSTAVPNGEAEFTFRIGTNSLSAGYSKLTLAVPVYAISAAVGRGTTAVVWKLQGGTDNSTFDDGANTGGSILLQVAPSTSNEPSVNVTSTVTGGNKIGWNATTETWTVSNSDQPVAIVLTADASHFTGTVTHTWMMAASDEVDAGDTDATTTLGAVASGDDGEILTLPTGNGLTALAVNKVFYIYCVADDGDDDATSNFTKFTVINGTIDTEITVVLPPTWDP